MAVYYWVGGTGTWDNTNTAGMWKTTSGGAINAPNAPLVTDAARFDGNSGIGIVSIAATATCLNFTLAGAGITATLIANNTTLNNNISSISAGVFNCSTFNCTMSTLTITGGTFTCNGGTITINGSLAFSGASPITATLNNSTLTISNSFSNSASNLIFSVGTSQINFTNAACSINTNVNTSFYNVNFTSNSISTISLSGINTFNNLTFASKSTIGISNINLYSGQTVNGTLTIPAPTILGSSRYFVKSNTFGTPYVLLANTVLLTDVDFMDIANTAILWTGTRLGNCGGNSGISFSSAKTVYWNLAGAQNYSATGWATTQTGIPADSNFPLAQDTAIFTDTNPVAGTIITLDIAYNIGTLNFSSRVNALTFATGIILVSIYGNVTLSSAVTLSGTSTITIIGRNSTQTITSAGVIFSHPINLVTIGGGTVFADAFATSSGIALTNGSLSTNYNITSNNFASSSTNIRSVSLGACIWSLTGSGIVWSINSTNFTLVSGTSKIVLTNTTTTARGFYGGSLAYNNLEIGGTTGISTLYIDQSNTFNTISSTKTVAHTILFVSGTTTTVKNFTVTGTIGNIVTISSDTTVPHNLINIGGNNISTDYMNISWSNASP